MTSGIENFPNNDPTYQLDKEKEAPTPSKPLSLPSRQTVFKFLRLGTGIGVLAILGSYLWRSQTSVVSHQAYINAPILSLHSPMQGQLTLNNLMPGETLTAGTQIGQVQNVRTPEIEVNRQQLQSQLRLNQSQLRLLQQKIANRRQLLAEFSQKLVLQQNYQATYHTQQIRLQEAQLRDAQHAAKLADVQAERYGSLVKAGAVSRDRADQAVTAAQRANEVVRNRQADLSQSRAEQAASSNGLQLSGSKTFSLPDIRARELRTEIADLEEQVQVLRTQIEQDNLKIAHISQQLTLKQNAPITVPTDSVVWSVERRSGALGQHVDSGDALIKLLDCKQVWVDAFMAEEDVRSLQIGSAVNVRLLTDGQQDQIEGRIQSIRSGVGRVVTGQDVALPPPELVKRAVAVRIMLASEDLKPERFCSVGRSVEVVVSR